MPVALVVALYDNENRLSYFRPAYKKFIDLLNMDIKFVIWPLVQIWINNY